MLFDSSIRKELARSFGATLVVLITVVMTMMLIRTLGQASRGSVAPADVMLVMGFTVLGQLPTILSLSLFITVVGTLSRMYRDSEMVIWFASGVSLSRFVRPVLRTCWPVLVVIALLLTFVWPWGNRQTQELRDRYQQRSDLSRVAPGVFQSSSDGTRVFFVDRDAGEATPDGARARNVFILSRLPKAESVTSARSGHLETVGDDRFLVLERGQRNEIDMQQYSKTLARFETYRVLAQDKALAEVKTRPPRATATVELEPAVRPARVHRLLQPREPEPGLGGQRTRGTAGGDAGAARWHVHRRREPAVVA
jgi:lipopolysaccharide export system permease protein